MQLSITATLTEEEIIILATEKGRQAKIQQPVEKEPELDEEGNTITVEPEYIEVDNPDLASDFITRVYKNMIIEDATKVFTTYRTKKLEEMKQATAAAVRAGVVSSIS